MMDMSADIYSLSLTNLALDGSLDLFVDLYRFTYSAYWAKLQKNPDLISDRETWNRLMIPEILPEFELLAFRRLRIFTTKIKSVHMQEHHFKRFDFIHEGKIKYFQHKKHFYEEWRHRGFSSYDERYLHNDNLEFEFQETVIGLQHFVNEFKRIVIRAIREEIMKTNPGYSIFDARKDVDARIADRMKMRQSECVVPQSLDHPPTEAPLFVFDALNNTVCKTNKHRVVSQKYYASHVDGKSTVVLPVHYCETCDRHMIGSLSLSLFREFSGKFIAQITKLYSDGNNEWNLQRESKLHQLGYNVVDGKLSLAERQNILISVIEGKQLTFFEVVATIEQNIRIFESNYRMQNAVVKWRTDLKFINEYMMHKKSEHF